LDAEVFFLYMSATISPRRAQERRDREFNAMKRNMVAALAAGAAFVAGVAIAAAVSSAAVPNAAGIFDDGVNNSVQVIALSN
jgi:hypothetical protein